MVVRDGDRLHLVTHRATYDPCTFVGHDADWFRVFFIGHDGKPQTERIHQTDVVWVRRLHLTK